MQNKNIKKAIAGEILRIIFFVLYYLVLLALGIVIISATLYGAYFILSEIISEVERLSVILLLILIVLMISLLFISFGVYLVKPFFTFKRNDKATRVKVTETECPELFKMIKEVAQETQCEMPQNVYLTTEANASVFYDTSLWSIIFPVKKNLEIGLGLFDGTSIDEIKSIIACEFGHFSKKNNKAASTVYMINMILYDFVNSDNSWIKVLDAWCGSSSMLLRIFGKIIRGFVNGINGMTACVYNFVQKGYLKLSQCMEYDADNIACEYAGTDNFVSAVCKNDLLANKDEKYIQILQSLEDEKKIITDYISGKETVSEMLSEKILPRLKYNIKLKEPVRLYDNLETRIAVVDIKTSHPSLEDRIANARKHEYGQKNEGRSEAAWKLVSNDIIRKVSKTYIEILQDYIYEETKTITDEEFAVWFENKAKEMLIDMKLYPFYKGDVIEFDLEAPMSVPEKSPITDENARKIIKYISDLEVMNRLNEIEDGSIKARNIQLDGAVYSRKQLPYERFKAELNMLREQVKQIYMDIFSYTIDKCDAGQKEQYKKAYNVLFRARQIWIEYVIELLLHRDIVANNLLSATMSDKEDLQSLISWLREYNSHITGIIKKIDWSFAAGTCIDEAQLDEINEYVKKVYKVNPSVSEVDEMTAKMLGIIHTIEVLVSKIIDSAQRTIISITIDVLDKEKAVN